MFFQSPVAALRNLRRAVRPGGRLMIPAGEAKRGVIEAELAAALGPHETPQGVLLSSSSWAVTAIA